MPIRVLLADDTDLMRHAIRKLITEEPRIELVGEASNFGQAMQLIADFKPQVLLLDLHLAEKREFLAALLQGTGGGRPGPISPRRSERSQFSASARQAFTAYHWVSPSSQLSVRRW